MMNGLTGWTLLEVLLGCGLGMTAFHLALAGLMELGFRLPNLKRLKRLKLLPRAEAPFAKTPVPKVAVAFLVNSFINGTCVGGALYVSLHHGGSIRPESSGWFRTVLEILYLFFLLDTVFYWAHRAFHRFPRVYVRIHALHHHARFPTVWHTHYEHFIDHFLTDDLPLLLVALLPISMSVETYLAAVIMISLTDIAGHSGHEMTLSHSGIVTPNGLVRRLDRQDRHVGSLFLMTVNHDMHHQRPLQGNFGRYFTIWDRICGTWNPERRREFLGTSPVKT